MRKATTVIKAHYRGSLITYRRSREKWRAIIYIGRHDNHLSAPLIERA
jgi:hypothetical protein